MSFYKIANRWLSERYIQECQDIAFKEYQAKIKEELNNLQKNNWTHTKGWEI